MKLLLAAAFLLPLHTIAQDCKLKETKDKFTQQPKLTTGFIGLNNARLSVDADAKEITFLFVFNPGSEQGCFDDLSSVAVAFDGTKTKANLKSAGPVNCEGFFHVVFKNTPTTATYLQRLSTQKVTSFTFTNNTKKTVVLTLTDDQKEAVMEAAICMADQAKKLIKTN